MASDDVLEYAISFSARHPEKLKAQSLYVQNLCPLVTAEDRLIDCRPWTLPHIMFEARQLFAFCDQESDNLTGLCYRPLGIVLLMWLKMFLHLYPELNRRHAIGCAILSQFDVSEPPLSPRSWNKPPRLWETLELMMLTEYNSPQVFDMIVDAATAIVAAVDNGECVDLTRCASMMDSPKPITIYDGMHAPDDKRPDQYKHGPLLGKGNEVFYALHHGLERDKYELRVLGSLAKHNTTIWLQRVASQNFAVWFKQEEHFKAAQGHMEVFQEKRKHSRNKRKQSGEI